MINRIFLFALAVAALIAAPFAAQAADLPTSYKAPQYVAPAYSSWTGVYVGINGGYGFGKSNWDVPAGTSISPKGPVVGATLGYNFQTGTWVWGIEGDLDYAALKGSATCGGGSCETKDSWLGTVRGRLGYAGWNNWLPYITGGLAMGDIKASSTATGLTASKTRLGWTLGLGVEYAMMTNWSVKLEYLYADLGKFDCGAACGATPDNVTFKANLVRAGVNYRF
jgi:outer membrane immunogenic protein